MKTKLDMHTHTVASDGSESAEELVKLAFSRGLELISITDHDSIDSLEAGDKEASKLGITFINGLELSVVYYHPDYKDGKRPMEVHLLGYDFDASTNPTNPTNPHNCNK